MRERARILIGESVAPLRNFFFSFDACTWSAKHLRKCNAQVTLTRGVTDTTQSWHKTLIKLRAKEYQLMIDLADVLAVFA